MDRAHAICLCCLSHAVYFVFLCGSSAAFKKQCHHLNDAAGTGPCSPAASDGWRRDPLCLGWPSPSRPPRVDWTTISTFQSVGSYRLTSRWSYSRSNDSRCNNWATAIRDRANRRPVAGAVSCRALFLLAFKGTSDFVRFGVWCAFSVSVCCPRYSWWLGVGFSPFSVFGCASPFSVCTTGATSWVVPLDHCCFAYAGLALVGR